MYFFHVIEVISNDDIYCVQKDKKDFARLGLFAAKNKFMSQ